MNLEEQIDKILVETQVLKATRTDVIDEFRAEIARLPDKNHPEIFEILCSWLQKEWPWCEIAVETIAWLHLPPDILEHFWIQQLNHSDTSVRNRAIAEIGDLEDPSLISVLEQRLEIERDKSIYQYIVDTILELEIANNG